MCNIGVALLDGAAGVLLGSAVGCADDALTVGAGIVGVGVVLQAANQRVQVKTKKRKTRDTDIEPPQERLRTKVRRRGEYSTRQNARQILGRRAPQGTIW